MGITSFPASPRRPSRFWNGFLKFDSRWGCFLLRIGRKDPSERGGWDIRRAGRRCCCILFSFSFSLLRRFLFGAWRGDEIGRGMSKLFSFPECFSFVPLFLCDMCLLLNFFCLVFRFLFAWYWGGAFDGHDY
jgi:hypothetical protein